MSGLLRVCVAACLVSVVAANAFAQNNDELNAGVEFNFSNPGARSLAIGGAFTALADDATAAYANPAGLIILAKPEVAGEGRHFNYEIPYADRGHPFGEPTGRGLDTVPGLTTSASETSANALSFLSFTYPSTRWSFAAYRHQLAKFKTEVQSTAIFATNANTGFVNRLFPTQGELEIDIVNYGLSGAFRIREDLLVGAGVSYYLGKLEGIQRRYGHGIPGNRGTAPGEDFGEPVYTDENLLNFTVERGSDSDIGFNLGVIYKPSERWSFGSVFRRGPSFEVQAARYFLAPDRSAFLFKSIVTPFRVPDVFAAGVAYRPLPGLVVAFDIDQVRYSQLVHDFGDLLSTNAAAPASLKFVVDDAFEARLGAEYVIRRATPIALRIGAWHDPDHRIRFDAGPTVAGDAEIFSAIVFRRGEDQIHITGGAGIVFTNAGQIDLAVDVADRTTTFSASFVTRFGN